jgi:hypothetical protein
MWLRSVGPCRPIKHVVPRRRRPFQSARCAPWRDPGSGLAVYGSTAGSCRRKGSTRCRHRAKDDRRLAPERAHRARPPNWRFLLPSRGGGRGSEQFDTAVHRSTCPVSPPPHPPMEADMDPIIEEFVHQQNLRRFQMLLIETKDEPRRHLLSKLLAEEQARDHPFA